MQIRENCKFLHIVEITLTDAFNKEHTVWVNTHFAELLQKAKDQYIYWPYPLYDAFIEYWQEKGWQVGECMLKTYDPYREADLFFIKINCLPDWYVLAAPLVRG